MLFGIRFSFLFYHDYCFVCVDGISDEVELDVIIVVVADADTVAVITSYRWYDRTLYAQKFKQ